MNDATIYDKTAEGEDAIREKTRLVQRNLRLVLVLVNGSADVASLKRSLGDAAMVESALIELERLGLIESEEACAARLAAVEQAKADLVPDLVERPLAESETVFDEEMASKIRVAPGFVSPVDEAEKPGKPSPLAAIPHWIEGLRNSRARAQEEALYERAYGSEAFDHESVESVSSIEPGEPSPLPPRRPRIGSRSMLAIALATVLVVLMAGVFLFPYDSYRPEFEQRLSLILDDTVTVGTVRIGFAPYPVITLEKVSVGVPVYAEADVIRLAPAAGFPFTGPRFSQAEVSGLRVREDALKHLRSWLLPAAMGDASVRELVFEGLSVELDGSVIGGLSGKAELEPLVGLGKLTFHAGDKLEVEVIPGVAGLSLAATARAWQPPFQPILNFVQLDVRGELTPGRFLIKHIDGLLYDGQLAGNGSLSWNGAAKLDLALEFQRLASGKLLAGLGAERTVEGETDGRLRLQVQAPSLDALDPTARMEGTFKVTRGNLKHLDLIEAMRTRAATPVRAGTTRFEEFTGSFAADPATVRFSDMRLRSGVLRGTGQASVSRQSGALLGVVRLEMRGSAEAARATLALSGSANSPVLKPGR
jgi:hypothetical protein